jgi:UDP-3-O-[3-hydroxymyristoyl] glucosamine N-acyltransferase
MQLSLEHIADAIEGELVGSGHLLLTGISFANEANPDEIAFAINKDDFRELEPGGSCTAGAVIVPLRYEGTRTNIIRVDNMQLAIAKAISLFNPKEQIQPKISSRADIHSSASLGEDVYIGPFASIGARSIIGDRVVIQSGVHIEDDVVIGDDTTLSYRVIILPHTQIGKRVVIQPGTLIGGDGFGYAKDGKKLFRIPHIGRVVIEDDVDIGAYNTIERGNLGRTLIRQGAKTGNLVYIAHNVYVGRHTRVGGNAGIAGNTFIGDGVLIGPMAGIAEELSIGNDVVIGPKASIIDDVASGGSAYGTPGMSRSAWLRSASLIPQLSKMRKEIIRMSRQIDELQSQLKD